MSELKRPLTGSQMMKLLPNVKIITYDELPHLGLNDLVSDERPACIILYMFAKNYGHYVALIKKKQYLLFFDSYGLNPDNLRVFKYVPHNVLQQEHETHKYLSDILSSSDLPVVYNSHRFQGPGTSTCGRYCAVRIWNSHMNDTEFKDFIYSTVYTPDELVTVLTENVLRNKPYNQMNLIKNNLKK